MASGVSELKKKMEIETKQAVMNKWYQGYI